MVEVELIRWYKVISDDVQLLGTLFNSMLHPFIHYIVSDFLISFQSLC